MSILLKNATFIDWKTLDFMQVNIFIEQGNYEIQFPEETDHLVNRPDTEVLDCTGKFVTKSFGVGHHHAYSGLARGMGSPNKKPESFFETLKYVWWTLDKCLDREMIEYSALVTAIACAKAGSTFVIDHHSSPDSINDSLEIIAKAFDKVGISHLLCYEVSDRDGVKYKQEGLDETESYLKDHQGLVGLHASFTVNNDTLEQAADLMNRFNSGVHIHVAEDQYDQDFCLRKYGKRVVHRLNDSGVLKSPKTLLSHCLHLNDDEKDIIRNSPCWIVQNTESNLNNNVGYFNSEHLGSNIMLGTDGMHSDMLRSAKAAFLVGQGFDNIDYHTTYRRFRNIHNYLSENHFIGDADNNLVVLDYDTPTPIDKNNFHGHFIFGISSNHISDVISNGKLIVRNRKMITVNEAEILEGSKYHADRLWRKMQE